MDLPLNVQDLKKAFCQGKRFKYIFFWGHRHNKHRGIDKSCFSQWYPAKFEIEGQQYGSAEHYMMAQKALLFGDTQTLTQILESPNPGAAKQLGRQVKGFTESTWQANCFEIVTRGNMAKFSQNKEMGRFLKATKNRIIVEASPKDKIWGIGLSQDHDHASNPLKWPGQNLLGFALMTVRSKLESYTSSSGKVG